MIFLGILSMAGGFRKQEYRTLHKQHTPHLTKLSNLGEPLDKGALRDSVGPRSKSCFQ